MDNSEGKFTWFGKGLGVLFPDFHWKQNILVIKNWWTTVRLLFQLTVSLKGEVFIPHQLSSYIVMISCTWKMNPMMQDLIHLTLIN